MNVVPIGKVIDDGLPPTPDKSTDAVISMEGTVRLTYKYGAKIGDDPIFKDTVKVNSEVGYSFVDQKVNSDFQIKTIKAPKLRMLEPLVKLYKGYVALGVTDFKSPPYFDFNYSTIRKREYSAGLALNHISQEQNIGTNENARYTNSNAMFFGKKFYKKSTWYSSLDYDFNSFRSYGFNDNQIVINKIGSTTALNTKAFEQYTEQIRVWALTDLGIRLMLPNEYE